MLIGHTHTANKSRVHPNADEINSSSQMGRVEIRLYSTAVPRSNPTQASRQVILEHFDETLNQGTEATLTVSGTPRFRTNSESRRVIEATVPS